MRLRTYQAFTVEEALEAVRRDLGADAVILETRTLRKGGFFGIGGATVVHVTAAESAAPPAPRAARPSVVNAYLAAADAEKRPAAIAAGPAPPRAAPPKSPQLEVPTLRAVVRAAVLEERRAAGGGAHPSAADPSANTAASASPAVPAAPLKSAAEPAHRDGAAASMISDTAGPLQQARSAERDATSDQRRRPARARSGVERDATAPGQSTDGSAARPPAAEPDAQELERHYRILMERDVSAAIAGAIIERVRRALSAEDLARPERVRGAVLELLAALLPASGAPLPQRGTDGRALTLAVVGSTGVGKTTSIAKLAAGLRAQRGADVGLIAADTSKRGAVAALRAYGEAIGVPVEVATDARKMQAAIVSLAGCDTILIDTPGRSPADSQRIGELVELLEAAEPHEVHLVVPATVGERSLLQIAEGFRPTGYTRVILSKLDETVAFGVIAGALRRIGASLSFVTSGQQIAGQIECGHSRRLAEWLLDGARRA